MQACLSAWKVWQSGFNLPRGPVKFVQACLSVRKDLESSFHHCGSPVKLVQACLRARKSLESSFHHCGVLWSSCKRVYMWEKTWQSRFNRRGGAVKHVLLCLSVRKSRESSFHHCWRPVMLVQTCLNVGKVWKNLFYPPCRCYQARAGLFKCQQRLWK